MNDRRQNYDEYIADVDAQFGRMLDALEAQRRAREEPPDRHLLDHGEFFERGVEGTHRRCCTIRSCGCRCSSPRRVLSPDDRMIEFTDQRRGPASDARAPSAGAEIPDLVRGAASAGLGGAQDPDRRIFMMDAKTNPSMAPIAAVDSFAMRTRAQHKLIYYRGLPGNTAAQITSSCTT